MIRQRYIMPACKVDKEEADCQEAKWCKSVTALQDIKRLLLE